ncbi:3'-5' exonuclease [Chitinimonas viridis]|uniref:3'-5' exonuclease n=1 Tax=Chitinimonas viridis TaxID=664880 RepID=A0ABT8AZM4_9NEIS|nr:3'-5' exonuclease [Chitinimonas viridis]MDN3575220.1 3'-5' exonuclease [Chitinimonas viridis]
MRSPRTLIKTLRRWLGLPTPATTYTTAAPAAVAKPPRHKPQAPLRTYDKAAIQAMPEFLGLQREAIVVVEDEASAASACAALQAAGVVGFDTESKPTFNKGEQSQGPHLIQLSTAECAYLFPVRNNQVPTALRELLMSPKVIKVGFDLRSDKAQMAANLKLHCQGIDDLVSVFRKQGYRNTIGAVQAVAILFGQHYRKSKSAKMSNWAAPQLNDSQQRYAANDAYVALRVYQALREKAQRR